VGIARSCSPRWAELRSILDDGKFTTNAFANIGGVDFVIKQQQNDRAWADLSRTKGWCSKRKSPPIQ